MKKGMELSMNTIIIAAIGLMVLVVLVMIFTGKMSDIRQSTNKTESQFSQERCEVPGTGRECMISEDACKKKGGFVYSEPEGGWSDCSSIEVCCSG
ncbi:MAG: hypothetical protein R6U32_07105 [Candidatus Woesearchaeota archaeon]